MDGIRGSMHAEQAPYQNKLHPPPCPELFDLKNLYIPFFLKKGKGEGKRGTENVNEF